MLSSSKTTVWCPSQTKVAMLNANDPLGRGVSLVKEEGIVLLGSPIGSIAFQREANRAKIDKIEDISSKLHLIKDPHVEFTLLRGLPFYT